jgi:outer membrane lipoprotein-sorting protein
MVALVSLGLCSAALAQTFDAAADPAFQNLLAANAGLGSYTAHITVHTRLRISSFTLHGTLYGKNGRVKIVFDDIPAIAKSTVENQPELPPPSTWATSYAISVGAKDALTTTYHLVPLTEDRVNSVDTVVQNASGLVVRYVWTNKNGLTITSDQTFAPVGVYHLVRTTTTKTRGDGIRADSETTFSDYQLGAEVPDSIFPAQ